MYGKNLIALFRSPRTSLAVFVALFLLGIGSPVQVFASDLPLAAGSPLSGVSFDDRPLLLPVQRNFQMAMLTASSQIGRSCGRMESYGWRMAQSEQHRVNLVFSNTVDRLRGLGYTVEAQTPSSISKDITLFTADRPDKHFLFMWSAGEIGLVMVLCESSPPLTGRMAAMYNATPAPVIAPPPQDVLQSKLETPAPSTIKGRKLYDANGFTPVGDWIGDYTCMRGYTGATLHIDKFKGEDFQGTFRFYPTGKNPYIPKGSYAVNGQYDKESKRILINPGKWLEHPDGYYKTVIIGSFDPVQRSFSGFFQGIMGCTSFEAKSDSKSAEVAPRKAAQKRTSHVKSKKKVVKKKPVTIEPMVIKNQTPDEAIAHVPDNSAPTTGAAKPAASTPAPAPQITSPVPATAPANSAPASPPVSSAPPSQPVPPVSTVTPSSPATPAAPASGTSAPASTPTPAPTTAAPTTTPSQTAPSDAAPPAPASSIPAPAAAPIPKPTSSLAPHAGPHAIVLAGDWPATPGPPQLGPAPHFSVNVPRITTPPRYNNSVPSIQPAGKYGTSVPELGPASNYDVNAPEVSPPGTYNTQASEIAPAGEYASASEYQPRVPTFNTNVPELPTAPSYAIYKAPGS